MPGGGARCYPSTGSSVMLPLDFSNGFKTVEIMICGGAPVGSFANEVYLLALFISKRRVPEIDKTIRGI